MAVDGAAPMEGFAQDPLAATLHGHETAQARSQGHLTGASESSGSSDRRGPGRPAVGTGTEALLGHKKERPTNSSYHIDAHRDK